MAKIVPKNQAAEPGASTTPTMGDEVRFRTMYGLVQRDIDRVKALADASTLVMASIVSQDPETLKRLYSLVLAVDPRDVERLKGIARKLIDEPISVE